MRVLSLHRYLFSARLLTSEEMFDMLRPSRRIVHERLSQNEDSDVAVVTPSSSVIVGRSDVNDTIETNAENENRGSIAAPGGGQTLLLPTVAVSSSSSVVAGDGSNNNNSSTAGGLRTSSMSFNSLIVPDGDGGTHHHNSNNNSDNDDDDVDDTMFDSVHTTTTTIHHPYLSAQIERERFIRYRRQSTCTLLVLLFLIRLWIEALLTKDIGLVFLSMMGTLWTYRWLANRTVDEEEYDRQIMLDLERHQGATAAAGVVREGGNNANAASGGGSSGRDAAINFDPDLGLMSFQAQLALAILESQRQMFENGGYNATTINSHNGPGVTNEAKEKWNTFDWGSSSSSGTTTTNDDFSSLTQSITRQGSDRSNNYGSLADDEKDAYDCDDIDLVSTKNNVDVEEEPSCSICLCEYDRGEKVVRLPCEHMYHESCLSSWTTHHTRCPLCNYDLMMGYEQPASVVTQQQAQQHAEEQRAFRNMALSALGRRIRPRNRMSTTSSNRRRGSSGTTAADMATASNDSIV